MCEDQDETESSLLEESTYAAKLSLLVRATDRADEGTEPSKRAVFREQAATRTATEWPINNSVGEDTSQQFSIYTASLALQS